MRVVVEEFTAALQELEGIQAASAEGDVEAFGKRDCEARLDRVPAPFFALRVQYASL